LNLFIRDTHKHQKIGHFNSRKLVKICFGRIQIMSAGRGTQETKAHLRRAGLSISYKRIYQNG